MNALAATVLLLAAATAFAPYLLPDTRPWAEILSLLSVLLPCYVVYTGKQWALLSLLLVTSLTHAIVGSCDQFSAVCLVGEDGWRRANAVLFLYSWMHLLSFVSTFEKVEIEALQPVLLLAAMLASFLSVEGFLLSLVGIAAVARIISKVGKYVLEDLVAFFVTGTIAAILFVLLPKGEKRFFHFFFALCFSFSVTTKKETLKVFGQRHFLLLLERGVEGKRKDLE
tara:strand:- start:1280 stop:1957 length:678 start_codon:yes stop_codon:yes gene_type:complete